MILVRLSSAALVLALATVSTGCGTILHGSNQQVVLQSEPSGAEVYSNGTLLGRTPTTATLARNSTHPLVFRMAGYADQPFQISRGIDGLALVGDILLGVVPLVIDFATGSVYKLSPAQAIVVMRREGASLPTAAPAADGVQVMFFTRAEVEAALGEHVLDGAVAQ